jgi:hypothetical protein
MNVRTLVERVLRESQDEFVQLVEQKLMKVLAEHTEQGTSASAGRTAARRPAKSAALATTKASVTTRVRATPSRPRAAEPSAPPVVEDVAVDNATLTADAAAESARDHGAASVDELDLPVLRALSRSAPLILLGGVPDDAVLGVLQSATGLTLKWVGTTADDGGVDQRRPWDDVVAGLVLVGAVPRLPAVRRVLAEARQLGHPVARSRDATLESLLAAFVVLEEAAAGGSAHEA